MRSIPRRKLVIISHLAAFLGGYYVSIWINAVLLGDFSFYHHQYQMHMSTILEQWGTVGHQHQESTVSRSTQQNKLFELHELGAAFAVYGSLQYRRVCDNVGKSSIVCMTIRYPWGDVALQDPSYSYPHPVDDRFYDLNKETSLVIVDGDMLEKCKLYQAISFDDVVKNCLDGASDQHNSSSPTVSVVFFRQQQRTGDINLFGVGYGKQLESAFTFFGKNVIHFYGDSISKGVIKSARNLFGGSCVDSPVERKEASFYCDRNIENLPPGGVASSIFPSHWERMDEQYDIFMGFDDTNRPGTRFDGSHPITHLPMHKRVEEMKMVRKRKKGDTNLRNVTFIIPYPLAHIQEEENLLRQWDDLKMRQRKWPELAMAGQTKEGRELLSKLGWNLNRIIVFDGFPQFFPTNTSGSFGKRNRDLFNKGKYTPIHGKRCRGPVPSTSKLAQANHLIRQSFRDLDLDMSFYIRSWEFSNQFWWMAEGMGKSGGLDCTHGVGPFYDAHVYLLQAVIDDYYEAD